MIAQADFLDQPCRKYILTESNEVRKARSWNHWRTWHDKVPKRVRTGLGKQLRRTCFRRETVSTVFLSSDHGWNSDTPIVFETMVFGGNRFNEHCTRYATYDDAMKGHAKWCRKVLTVHHNRLSTRNESRRKKHARRKMRR